MCVARKFSEIKPEKKPHNDEDKIAKPVNNEQTCIPIKYE